MKTPSAKLTLAEIVNCTLIESKLTNENFINGVEIF